MKLSRFTLAICRVSALALMLALMRPPLGATAGLARAAEEPKKTKDIYVDMQPVGLPVVQDQKLVNYVFVTVRVMLAPGADPNKVHEHEPFIRDRLIRIASKSPFLLPHETSRLDDVRLKATLLGLTRDALGAAAVRSVVIAGETAQH